MQQPRAPFCGDLQKMMAQSLYDAGQTDTQIGLAIGVSVNNIIHWRKDLGLAEHLPPAEEINWSANGEIFRPHAVRSHAGQTDTQILPPAPRRQAVPAAIPPAAAGTNLNPEPVGDNALEIGTGIGGKKVFVDLEELLTTRLLVQGNSGSGKSHLLRKLLEEATGIIQQVIVDPEGDFVSLGETFGHTVIDAGAVGIGKMAAIARRVREHRASAVLNLEAFDPDQQMEAVAAFLTGLFDAPQEQWFPALIVVDEAQLFAPIADNGEDRDARKASLAAMTNLMCRGRKRGLAGVLATQRVAKLHKNVASEASNFLIGRTFMDIDMARAADLLGLARREAEQVRDLNRGEFLGLGPAISRRPAKVKVGDVLTVGKASARGLTPLPAMTAEQMQDLLLADDEAEEAPVPALRAVR